MPGDDTDSQENIVTRCKGLVYTDLAFHNSMGRDKVDTVEQIHSHRIVHCLFGF